MKKETLISLLLIALGFVFEGFYFVAESTFWDAKFWLSGVFCIIAGVLGLWIYTIAPYLEKKTDKQSDSMV